MGVKTISVWALSSDNISGRSASELNTLSRLFIRASKDPQILALLEKNGTRVRVVGNMGLLPKKLRDSLNRLEARTKGYKDFSINILVGYGGREDIMHAVRKILAEKGSSLRLNYETIKRNLLTAILPDVDLIIRTSGEMRLSGLLPWQGSYSELYFSKKYWPSFTREDLTKAITTFSKRKRRFGK